MSKLFPNEQYADVYKTIISNNRNRDKFLISKHGEFNSKAVRRKELSIPDRKNIRPAFFHDIDRIIHCDAYSRYIDKTQVFSLAKNDHVTRRVLHVQLVSKIARTMARFFRANEDLVEAIALAHDIGHAPLGHFGEEVIAEILEEKNEGSFVHNAQSVRILEVLENGGKGLKLSLQVLDGVLGHNGEFWDQKISFDRNSLTWKNLDNNLKKCLTRPRSEKPDKEVFPSTLEGCIVRVSDVIAYVGRDIEDAISIRMIKRKSLPEEAKIILGDKNSDIINNLVMNIVHNSVDGNSLQFSGEVFEALKSLLDFNYKKIYNNPKIVIQHKKFKPIIRDLFNDYLEDVKKEKADSIICKDYLFRMSKDYIQNTSHYRIVADYVSGMTDRFLVDQYKIKFLPDMIEYKVLNN